MAVGGWLRALDGLIFEPMTTSYIEVPPDIKDRIEKSHRRGGPFALPTVREKDDLGPPPKDWKEQTPGVRENRSCLRRSSPTPQRAWTALPSTLAGPITER